MPKSAKCQNGAKCQTAHDAKPRELPKSAKCRTAHGAKRRMVPNAAEAKRRRMPNCA
jgi:hypothetical protein